MKTIALALVLIFAPVGVALADNDVGCGVGTQIWEGEEGLAPKLFASFTNGLLFQSVSITFGLINCDGRSKVTADAGDLRLKHYASSNFDRLFSDMAEGRGQSLEAFSSLLGIPAAERAEFGVFAQRNFAALYTHDRVTVGEMLTTLNRLMADDARFSAYARS